LRPGNQRRRVDFAFLDNVSTVAMALYERGVAEAISVRRLLKTRAGLAIGAGLAAALALLLIHIRTYWFLTDDAFISFRYARNLHDGYGLVFNPGFERVEGYTDFLWVLLLAAVQGLTGLAPHKTANWLSASAGVLVWMVVLGCCARRLRGRHAPGWLLLPAFWLALNRSFAVWCTSGLETKLFELLVVGGIVLLIDGLDGGPLRWTLAALLLSLAALTRPDGILIGTCALAAAALCAWWVRRLDLRGAAAVMSLFGIVVAAHFAFRWIYYGDLLPNTYYVKIDGESWWDMGSLYLRAFLLEYGAAVWLPLVLLAAFAASRQHRGTAAVVIGAVVLPHAIYVAYCGGSGYFSPRQSPKVSSSLSLLRRTCFPLTPSSPCRASGRFPTSVDCTPWTLLASPIGTLAGSGAILPSRGRWHIRSRLPTNT
jgi:hypothetical protein